MYVLLHDKFSELYLLENFKNNLLGCSHTPLLIMPFCLINITLAEKNVNVPKNVMFPTHCVSNQLSECLFLRKVQPCTSGS